MSDAEKTADVGRPPGNKWESFKILFHRFADIPSAVGQSMVLYHQNLHVTVIGGVSKSILAVVARQANAGSVSLYSGIGRTVPPILPVPPPKSQPSLKYCPPSFITLDNY